MLRFCAFTGLILLHFYSLPCDENLSLDVSGMGLLKVFLEPIFASWVALCVHDYLLIVKDQTEVTFLVNFFFCQVFSFRLLDLTHIYIIFIDFFFHDLLICLQDVDRYL